MRLLNNLNEDGNNTIFLTIVVSSLLLIIFSFIDIVRFCVAKNNVKEVCLIGINDVLCDYCMQLYNEYHLLGIIYQSNEEIEKLINDSVLYNLNYTKFNKAKVNSIKIVGGRKINDLNSIYEQIHEYMDDHIFDSTKKYIIGEIPDVESLHETAIEPPNEEEYEDIVDYANLDNRNDISNRINEIQKEDIILDDSFDARYNITFENAVTSSTDFINQIKLKFDFVKDNIIALYAIETFDCLLDANDEKREKIFDCEIEYLIAGDKSQNNNIQKVKEKILLMLYPDKLIEIYKDDEKVSSAILISEAICGWWATEGGVTLIKNLILASWAYDLANEDYQKLINGFPIKLSYIDGELKYEDFLYILLIMNDNDILLERILKLIDVNLKMYNSMFSVNNVYTDLEVECEYLENNIFSSKMCVPIKIINNYYNKVRIKYGY